MEDDSALSAALAAATSRMPTPASVAEPSKIDLECYSALQRERMGYTPRVPAVFAAGPAKIRHGDCTTAEVETDAELLARVLPHTFEQPLVHIGPGDGPSSSSSSSLSLSSSSSSSSSSRVAPLTVGILFCGRQTPGGHNVVTGLYEYVKQLHPASRVLGFVGGTLGLFEGRFLELTDEIVARYRNQGGYHLLGRTVDQIRRDNHRRAAWRTAIALGLDALVLIGGTHTNSDAAHLAEFFVKQENEELGLASPVASPTASSSSSSESKDDVTYATSSSEAAAASAAADDGEAVSGPTPALAPVAAGGAGSGAGGGRGGPAVGGSVALPSDMRSASVSSGFSFSSAAPAATWRDALASARAAPRASRCAVIGVPVTIDGDLKNQFVEATLGFDTATKVYSQLVGNMATDGNSAQKYYYFVRLMGRHASHITLECALQTQPNVVLLGEEIDAHKMSLSDIVRELADVVSKRAALGKNFGVVLVPEGIVAHIPELRTLIDEMNLLFAEGIKPEEMKGKLTPWSSAVLDFLPSVIRKQLFLDRESHGTVQLSQVSSEMLLADLVADELARRKRDGKFKGKFATITHFFGYQARCALPSNFDCDFGHALGLTAGALAQARANGYLASVRNLNGPVDRWEPVGVPLSAMLAVQETPSGIRAVIPSAKVDLEDGPFQRLRTLAKGWMLTEAYANPGPIQYRGRVADERTATLGLERHDYMVRIAELKRLLSAVQETCRPGVNESILGAALSGLSSLTDILTMMKRRA